MGQNLQIEGRNFAETIQVELDKYTIDVGILQDKPVNAPVPGKYKTYAGQRLAQTSRRATGESLADVARQLDRRFHWLERPWRIEQNQDVIQVVDDIIDSINKDHAGKQRVLNGVQAVIRNPILGNYYGRNSAKWASIKGFNKLLMYTGQFFQNIKAKYVS